MVIKKYFYNCGKLDGHCDDCPKKNECYITLTEYCCSDANHFGVLYTSTDKEMLEKFARLLAEEGAAMSDIDVKPENTKMVVCNIDEEWDGHENINPFYYWYYDADKQEEPEDDGSWKEHEVYIGGRVEGFGKHYYNKEYEAIIEPGYYGLDDGNSTWWIAIYNNKEAAEAAQRAYNEEGACCFIVEPCTEYEWAQLHSVNLTDEELDEDAELEYLEKKYGSGRSKR